MEQTEYVGASGAMIMLSLELDPRTKERHWLGEQGDSCRFCGRTRQETAFKNDAHVLPQVLGRSELLSYDECDECNHSASPLENDLCRFLAVGRLTALMPSKRTRPYQIKARTGDLQVAYDWTAGWIQSNYSDDQVDVLPGRSGVRVSFHLQPYKVANVARALTRIAMFMMSPQELDKLRPLMAWVRNKGIVWPGAKVWLLQGPIPEPIIRVRLQRPETSSESSWAWRVDLQCGAHAISTYLPSRALVPPDIAPREGWREILAGEGESRDVGSFEVHPVDGYRPPSDNDVAVAAYSAWMQRGSPTGDDLVDWLEAERSLVLKRMSEASDAQH